MGRPRKTTTTPAAQSNPKTEKVLKASSTRTKDDVSSAFMEVKKSVANTEAADPKLAELLNSRRRDVESTVAGMSIEKTVQGLSTLGLDVSRSLNLVQEQISDTLAELHVLQEAVELKRAELSQLHDADVAATALSQMVDEYEKKRVELETELAEKRNDWNREQAEHARAVAERNTDTAKSRMREESDYKYAIERERKVAQDTYEETLRAKTKEVLEKNEKMMKEWAAREEAVSSREAEFADMKKKVESFQDTVNAEVAKAEAILKNSLTRDFTSKFVLQQKEAESDRRVLELRVQTFEENLKNRDALIANLQDQLVSAGAKVQEIASKALDSASGKQALAAVTQQIAKQQEASVRTK